MNKFVNILVLLIGLMLSTCAFSASPECDGVDNWASNMAFVYLKNAGLTDNDKVLWGERTVQRLASEKIGTDLYRQVHLVTLPEKGGNEIRVITVNDASHEECSMSAVDVYVISKQLGGK